MYLIGTQVRLMKKGVVTMVTIASWKFIITTLRGIRGSCGLSMYKIFVNTFCCTQLGQRQIFWCQICFRASYLPFRPSHTDINFWMKHSSLPLCIAIMPSYYLIHKRQLPLLPRNDEIMHFQETIVTIRMELWPLANLRPLSLPLFH